MTNARVRLRSIVAALAIATTLAVAPAAAAYADGDPINNLNGSCDIGEACLYWLSNYNSDYIRDEWYLNNNYVGDNYVNRTIGLNDSVWSAKNYTTDLPLKVWKDVYYSGNYVRFLRTVDSCNPSACWQYQFSANERGTGWMSDQASSHKWTSS